MRRKVGRHQGDSHDRPSQAVPPPRRDRRHPRRRLRGSRADPAAPPPVTPAAPATTTLASVTGHEHDWDWLAGRWDRQAIGSLQESGSLGCTRVGGVRRFELALADTRGPGHGGRQCAGTAGRDLPRRGCAGLRSQGRPVVDLVVRRRELPRSSSPPCAEASKDGEGTLRGRRHAAQQAHQGEIYRWSKITPTSAHWEQAFSPDAGATWEINWEDGPRARRASAA